MPFITFKGYNFCDFQSDFLKAIYSKWKQFAIQEQIPPLRVDIGGKYILDRVASLASVSVPLNHQAEAGSSEFFPTHP